MSRFHRRSVPALRAAAPFAMAAVLWVTNSNLARGAESTTPPAGASIEASTAGSKAVVDFDPGEAQQKVSWYPETSLDLTLRPPPVQLVGTTASAKAAEEAIIPLPPAAWSGLAGLGLMSLPGFRRVLHRLVR